MAWERNPALLIHVGYPKTGTTWLQSVLFTPGFGYHQILDQRAAYKLFVASHPFDADADDQAAEFQRRLAETDPGLVPVLSSENLMGDFFRGAVAAPAHLRRLHALHPDGRVLIFIRNQLSLLPSVYMQYLRQGGAEAASRLFSDDFEMNATGFDLRQIEYDRYVELSRAVFGPGRVRVFTQEGLARDPVGTARAIAEFAGAPTEVGSAERRGPVNVGAAEFAAPALRRINHLRSGALKRDPVLDLGPVATSVYRGVSVLSRTRAARTLLGGFRPISKMVRARYADRFIESNRRLASLLGDEVDLAGYPGLEPRT